ncbi:MAG: hypothetical protein LRY46_01940, partial [Candidatus Pacebacteria bacterium]|nr:hypothetical protein [Candidatus Paceibacterota bacterium]
MQVFSSRKFLEVLWKRYGGISRVNSKLQIPNYEQNYKPKNTSASNGIKSRRAGKVNYRQYISNPKNHGSVDFLCFV